MTKVLARTLAALALAAVLHPRPAIVLADGGSDFTRCVMACNEARKVCQDACKVDCTELFPGSQNEVQRDACIATCKAECSVTSEECKTNCKTEPSPDEP